jgi:hypothetical protein
MVELGAAVAQTAIETAAATPGDDDAALLRLGVLEFLRAYAESIHTESDEEPLVRAYQDWLKTAVELYSTGDESLVPKYMRRGEALRSELERAATPDRDGA